MLQISMNHSISILLQKIFELNLSFTLAYVTATLSVAYHYRYDNVDHLDHRNISTLIKYQVSGNRAKGQNLDTRGRHRASGIRVLLSNIILFSGDIFPSAHLIGI